MVAVVAVTFSFHRRQLLQRNFVSPRTVSYVFTKVTRYFPSHNYPTRPAYKSQIMNLEYHISCTNLDRVLEYFYTTRVHPWRISRIYSFVSHGKTKTAPEPTAWAGRGGSPVSDIIISRRTVLRHNARPFVTRTGVFFPRRNFTCAVTWSR